MGAPPPILSTVLQVEQETSLGQVDAAVAAVGRDDRLSHNRARTWVLCLRTSSKVLYGLATMAGRCPVPGAQLVRKVLHKQATM